eukprot:3358839-Prymnesium_polylepis.1
MAPPTLHAMLSVCSRRGWSEIVRGEGSRVTSRDNGNVAHRCEKGVREDALPSWHRHKWGGRVIRWKYP